MQEILIEKIRTDGGVQSRERISEEYVAELAELITAGKKLPPVDVYNDGTDVWAADGFHRIFAHIKADKRTIRCNVRKGTKTEAMWASCAANQEHGLRRTNEDKRRAVELALKMRAELSDRAVAGHVGVHEDTVKMIRRALLQVGEIHPPAARIGVDGKTYRIPPPSFAKATEGRPPISRLPPPPSGERTKREGDAPGRIPPPPSGESAGSSGQCAARKGENSDPHPHPLPSQGEGEEKAPPEPAKRSVRFDGVKKPIPDHLIPLFDRGSEVQALLSQISSIKGVLKRAQESDDALYGDCHFQAAEAALQTAFTEIKATKPFAVCPWCHGILTENCKGCGQRGVLGEFRWKQSVPMELKQ